MTAPTLLTFFNAVYLLALANWVGSIAFFSFGVAPIVFRVLGPEAGTKFGRTLFPRYYLWGATAAAIALPAVVCGPMTYPELRGPTVGIQALFVIVGALVMLYCGNSLTPAINAARDAGPAGAARFDALHKRSVRLNALALLIGTGLLIAFAARDGGRSGGIVERPPGELDEGQKKLMRDSIEIEKVLRDPEAVERLMKAVEARKKPPEGKR
jgi:Domain of unknown function (DUF4149)